MISESISKDTDLLAKVLKVNNSKICLKCGDINSDLLTSYYIGRGLLLKYAIRKLGEHDVEYVKKNNFDIINACFCDNCLNNSYKKHIKKQIDNYSTDVIICLTGFILAPFILYASFTSDGPMFGETVAGFGQGMSVVFVIFGLLLALYTAFAPFFIWKFIRYKNILKKGNSITKVSDGLSK